MGFSLIKIIKNYFSIVSGKNQCGEVQGESCGTVLVFVQLGLLGGMGTI
jgi:hypothetical protein